MKNLVSLIAFIALLIAFTDVSAQTQNPTPPAKHERGFVDKNGDGYNDNAPDHDGDGIPNCIDPDYKGPKLQKNKFIDLNGDGINDNAGIGKRGGKSGKGMYGTTCNGTSTQGTGGRGYNGGK
jgi:hypothetical protein